MESKKNMLTTSDLTQDQILSYGQDVTNDISSFSVRMLDKLGKYNNDDAGKVLVQLNGIMKSFDLEDFEQEKKGFLGKVFNNASKKIDKIMAKYTSFNTDIDKVYKEIKTYEFDIKDSNQMLDEMFEENRCYHQALSELIDEANNILDKIKGEVNSTEDKIGSVDLTDKAELLEQRIYDLELARAVSVQTAPQIKLLQKTNNDLLRKINSSFVITLPIFRQGLIQAITIKRQAIQTKALQGLDDTTNELLMKNATNIVDNSKNAAKLNGSPIVQIETLRKSYSTIIEGIKEVESLELANKAARADGLEAIKNLKDHMINGIAIEGSDDVMVE